MSETYNPRERTFIKKPEIKTCPTCGNPMVPDVKPMTNIMNRYINPISGRVTTMNHGDEIVEIEGVKLYRCETSRDEKGQWYSKFVPKVEAPKVPVNTPTVVAPTPAAPAAPTIVLGKPTP